MRNSSVWSGKAFSRCFTSRCQQASQDNDKTFNQPSNRLFIKQRRFNFESTFFFVCYRGLCLFDSAMSWEIFNKVILQNFISISSAVLREEISDFMDCLENCYLWVSPSIWVKRSLSLLIVAWLTLELANFRSVLAACQFIVSCWVCMTHGTTDNGGQSRLASTSDYLIFRLFSASSTSCFSSFFSRRLNAAHKLCKNQNARIQKREVHDKTVTASKTASRSSSNGARNLSWLQFKAKAWSWI